MALPVFRPQQVPYQAVTPVGQQAQAQLYSSLSDRLMQFSNAMAPIAREENEIKYYQKAINDLQNGNVEPALSVADKAYGDLGSTQFMTGVESDLKHGIDKIQMEAKNPDEFNQVADKFVKTTLSQVQNPTQKAMLASTIQKKIEISSSAMGKQQFDKVLKSEIEAVDTGLKMAREDYISAFSSGNLAKADEAEAKMMGLYKRGIQLGSLSPNAINYKLKELYNEAEKVKTQADFISSEATGQANTFISDFLKKTDITPEKKLEMVKFFKNYTNEKFDALSAENKKNQELIVATSQKYKNSYEADIISGKRIDLNEIENKVKEGVILPKDYQSIVQLQQDAKAGAIVSDSVKVIEYLAKVESLNPKVVISDMSISAKDKEIIVNKIITHQQQERQNQALTSFIQANGASPWRIVDDKLSANFKATTSIDRELMAKTIQDVKQKMRQDVSLGKISALEVGDKVDEYIKAKKADIKFETDTNKYNRDYKQYQEDYKKWQKESQGNWNKLKTSINPSWGVPMPQAPTKPVKGQ